MANMNENNRDATGTIAGFSYQLMYFVYRLLILEKGEVVSLEKMDDVGAEIGEEKVYYQLKHTIKGSESNPINIPLKDRDLWKTIDMWIDILSKKGPLDQQKSSIEKSKFLLVSNKKASDNKFLEMVGFFQQGGISEPELDQHLQKLFATKGEKDEQGNLIESSTDKQIRNLVKYPLRAELLKKLDVNFVSDKELEDDIIYEIRYSKGVVDEENARYAMLQLLGAINIELQKKTPQKQYLEYTKEIFAEKYSDFFSKYKNRKFVPTNRTIDIPKEPLKQTFIRQLLDVDYMAADDDHIVSYTKDRLNFENDYNNAKAKSDMITQNNFEDNVIRTWENRFKKHNRKINSSSSDDEMKTAGYNVVSDLLGEELCYGGENLGLCTSNGCFFYFSDGEHPYMGWRYDWENKYNGGKWIIE